MKPIKVGMQDSGDGKEGGVSELRPAKPPFTRHPNGEVVQDADGDFVITCSYIAPMCSLWKDDCIQGLTECPKCNRMMIRMVFATPQDCGIEVKP